MKEQLENPMHYEIFDSDPREAYTTIVRDWSSKWLTEGQTNSEIANWVANAKAEPGKIFAMIKTHKNNNPLRLITSCKGTATQNFSSFTQFYLKLLAQKLPSFSKSTTHFLNKLKEINKTGPFPQGTLQDLWDVLSTFPNIDNELGILSIAKALDSRSYKIPSTQCTVEAVKYGLEHNNSQFFNTNYLQIHGTAMDPKNACSYADLAMGEIHEKAKSNGELKPNWCLR